MTKIYYVDFKNKSLLNTVVVETEIPQANAEKLKYFTDCVNDGMTMVHISPSAPGVKIPDMYRNQLSVTINWSFKFHLRDFAFDENGVRGTLSFDGKPFFVDLPWHSIWRIGKVNSEEGKEWPKNHPREHFGDGPDFNDLA